MYTTSEATEATGAIRIGDLKLIVGPEKQASWYGVFSPNSTKKPDVSFTACSLSAPCLYDVRNDPSEHVDLASARPDDVKRMLERFHALAKEYHPPKKNPPQENEAYCKAMHDNGDFVRPWH